jgi:23S rRNA (uracil1939-C5)-methyltransferase
MAKKEEIVRHVLIEDVAAEGKCIARVNEKVVFVDKTAPGDVVDLQIKKKKKNYNEAIAIHFHEYSKLRVDPLCQHFGLCGGCKWQHLDYNAQLKLKAKQVVDNLERIAKVPFPEVLPIIGADTTTFYRNKLEFTFSNKRWLTREEVESGLNIERNALGFHLPGRFDKILDVETCFLQEDPSNEIRLRLKEFALSSNLEFYDVMEHKGFLRNLVIRTANTGEIMVIVQVAQNDQEQIEKVMGFIVKTFPSIHSLFYVVNTKRNDTFFDLELINYNGAPFITEKMENLEFRIGPKTFFQTNSAQALKLYQKTSEFAGLTGNERVYDLYTGAGSIANFVAAKAKQVIGIEYVPEAIEDAKINAAINKITNTTFIAGDAVKVLDNDFVTKYGKPDVIITDPPRAGMHPDVTKKIAELEPQKIVYVSCNPATQARDVAVLDEKYEIVAIQPVDMFPHTQHVENIISFKKKAQNGHS